MTQANENSEPKQPKVLKTPQPPQLHPKKLPNFPEAKWQGKKTFKKTDLYGEGEKKYSDSDLRDLAEFLVVMIYSAVDDLREEQEPSENQDGESESRDYRNEIQARAAKLNQKRDGRNG